MLKTILIDMYGVIIKESKGYFIPYTLKHFEEEKRAFLSKAFYDDKLFTRAGNGEFTSKEFLELLGYQDTEYIMKDYIDNYLTFDTEFNYFAEKLNRRISMVLLSNDISEWSEYITKKHNLNRYFDDRIVSGDVKLRKPDKRIFEYTLNRLGRKPEECVFIDNSTKNLHTAEGLGIKTILFNRDNESYEGKTVYNFYELIKVLEDMIDE